MFLYINLTNKLLVRLAHYNFNLRVSMLSGRYYSITKAPLSHCKLTELRGAEYGSENFLTLQRAPADNCHRYCVQ